MRILLPQYFCLSSIIKHHDFMSALGRGGGGIAKFTQGGRQIGQAICGICAVIVYRKVSDGSRHVQRVIEFNWFPEVCLPNSPFSYLLYSSLTFCFRNVFTFLSKYSCFDLKTKQISSTGFT